jgi:hypothetical protein
MGYTHYYRYAPNHPRFRAGWPQLVTDAQRIVDRVRAAGVVILGFGDTPPVSAEGIALAGDYTQELHVEPFIVSPTPLFVPVRRRVRSPTSTEAARDA